MAVDFSINLPRFATGAVLYQSPVNFGKRFSKNAFIPSF